MPTVVILAGPNGAGKSTVALEVISDLMTVGAFVNDDTIARGLAAFDSESVAMQAGRIMLERLRELAVQQADFAFETTRASRSFVPFIRQLRMSGYTTQIIYVWLSSPELCVRRVHERVHAGGHIVEDDTVRRRYLRSLWNFFTLYGPLADDWQVSDNSDEAGADLVAEGQESSPTAIHHPDVWERMIRSAGS